MTTHTPNDIKRSYPRPFSTSLHAVPVGYLTYADVRQFLREPAKNFLPYCDGCAIQSIMEWTAGQPYLVQLIAYHLIDCYNRHLDGDVETMPPFFTRETIAEIIKSTSFKSHSTHYFLNLLDEVRQVKVEYVDLLKKIVSTPNQLTQADQIGLRRLEERGIIERPQPHYQGRSTLAQPTYKIRVKLFGRWLRGVDVSRYRQ